MCKLHWNSPQQFEGYQTVTWIWVRSNGDTRGDSTPEMSQLNPNFNPEMSQLNPNFNPEMSQLNPNFNPEMSQLNPKMLSFYKFFVNDYRRILAVVLFYITLLLFAADK